MISGWAKVMLMLRAMARARVREGLGLWSTRGLACLGLVLGLVQGQGWG
jgi:hypothetical protein